MELTTKDIDKKVNEINKKLAKMFQYDWKQQFKNSVRMNNLRNIKTRLLEKLEIIKNAPSQVLTTNN